MNILEYIKNTKASVSLSGQEHGPSFQKADLKKGDFLFRQGSMCHTIFFIERGLARTFYYLESGKEVTAWFSAEEEVVTSIDSFNHRKVTQMSCELLEDSSVYFITIPEMERLLNEDHEFAKMAFIILLEITTKIVDFMTILKFKTAKERYTYLRDNNPQVFQRMPLFQIASYLGISPETLSRLRAE